jgi:hypothetical protein
MAHRGIQARRDSTQRSYDYADGKTDALRGLQARRSAADYQRGYRSPETNRLRREKAAGERERRDELVAAKRRAAASAPRARPSSLAHV